MRIIGHGVDIVEVPRIAEMVERHGDHFLGRVFTAAERAYADASPRRRALPLHPLLSHRSDRKSSFIGSLLTRNRSLRVARMTTM